MVYNDKLEEEVKNRIAQDYFELFDCATIIGKIDFCVTFKTKRHQPELGEIESLLWAEAKKGKSNIYESIVQLILTVGKARTFDKQLPPAFLGAFDAESISFIPYNDIQDIFYQNDFNWNVTPSNHKTKEFKQVLETVKTTIEAKSLSFAFAADDTELRQFIKDNFVAGKSETSKTRIDKNNFTVIYNKWLSEVKPTIEVVWDTAKKHGIIDGDFYLADLLSKENYTLKEKLYVLLKGNQYQMDRKANEMGMFSSMAANFNDNQKAHQKFWNKYDRPPLEEYWDYIVERRDLLVSQDVRERKGSFFTPKIWVELSQKYLADVLGEDWQDEYYIWDCAAGTGNLLTGLVNKYNIWASTLDKQDVDVMHDRIKNGANLLESHVFQFDFLNGDFKTLPQGLQDIINDPEKRKKLVMYINPPYAEAGSGNTFDESNERRTKTDVANTSKIWAKYKDQLGLAIRELFAQFFIKINQEIPDCIMGSFSKVKYVNGDGFSHFRALFNPQYKSGFVVPADTFDNVKGNFPIGFLIWDFAHKATLQHISTDIYNKQGEYLGQKNFYNYKNIARITDWITKHDTKSNVNVIGYTGNSGPDFQHNNYCYLSSQQKINQNQSLNNDTKYSITKHNFRVMAVYFAVRHAIDATWLNDRDQFLYPNDGWQTDTDFQNDCLAFALFDGQNRISSAENSPNHWIPFTEKEVNARDKFASNFMSQYIAGKIKAAAPAQTSIDEPKTTDAPRQSPLVFSAEAKAVFDAGRELWLYYHAQPNSNVNGSLYDIRAHFQGRTAAGRMNSSSNDTQYTTYLKALRDALKVLAERIAEKVYLYGFLKA